MRHAQNAVHEDIVYQGWNPSEHLCDELEHITMSQAFLPNLTNAHMSEWAVTTATFQIPVESFPRREKETLTPH